MALVLRPVAIKHRVNSGVVRGLSGCGNSYRTSADERRGTVRLEDEFYISGHAMPGETNNIDRVRVQNSLADWAYRGAPPLHKPLKSHQLVQGDRLYPSYSVEADIASILGRIAVYSQIDGEADTHVKVLTPAHI